LVPPGPNPTYPRMSDKRDFYEVLGVQKDASQDDIKRSYRKLALMPAFVVVGMGEEDYLAQWRADVRKAAILSGLFLLVTVCTAWLLWRLIRANERAHRRSQILLQNARNGIHIIDLRKTQLALANAERAVRDVTLQGDRVLFVCTKRQLRPVIEQEAERCGMHFVSERWLGGMLTNFATIRKQIRRLKELERGIDEGQYEFYTKKEQLMLRREKDKLDKYLRGVKDMGRMPGALFVVDAKKEMIAVREANKLGLPVIAIADTNADPDRND